MPRWRELGIHKTRRLHQEAVHRRNEARRSPDRRILFLAAPLDAAWVEGGERAADAAAT